MRTASAICLFFLLTAHTASSEIIIKGDSDFGVSHAETQECEDQEVVTVGCFADLSESTPKPGEPWIGISGEARMGLVYDGESVRPRSKVSITISFGAVTDGGMRINGSTTLPSVQ